MHVGGYASLRPLVPLVEALELFNPLAHAVLLSQDVVVSVAMRIRNFCSFYFSFPHELQGNGIQCAMTVSSSSAKNPLEHFQQASFSQIQGVLKPLKTLPKGRGHEN